MSLVWEAALPTSDKMVLLAIADSADDDGDNAWPSISTLARKASVSERRVQQIVKGLESRGLLAVQSQAGGHRGMRDDRRPNLYCINLHGVKSIAPRWSDGVKSDVPRGEIIDAYGVKPISPNSSLEPSNRTSFAGQEPGESEGRRVNRLTKHYSDRVPMCRFPAIAQIVKMAVKAGHEDDAIIAALLRLADSGRSVTVETLRLELEGHGRRPSGSEMYARAARLLESVPEPVGYRAIQASGGGQ